MTKADKLKLYGQKDYSEVIEFPVELVGKDGIVRRYTYEESLLVYAKRIESAHVRYRDRDIAAAEVDHCYKRIEQIKKSWKVISARKVSSNNDYAAKYEESAAAECRAFVREYFGKALAERVATDEEPIPIYLSLVEQGGPAKVFHVSLANRKGSYLLYAYTFGWEPEQGATELDARSQFSEKGQILATTPDGEDVERLLAAREGKDFGFLLSGPVGAPGPGPVPDEDADRPRKPATGMARRRVQSLLDEDPTNAEAHYAMGVLLMNEGDLPGAAEELKSCVELQPYYLDAYRLFGQIVETIGAYDDAEPYLLQGRHYFPDDEKLLVHLATWYLRGKRYDDAEGPLERLLAIDPAHSRAKFLKDVMEHARRTGADPAAALDRRNQPPRPSALAIIVASIALGLSVALGWVEPMASAFALAMVMAGLTIHGARLRDAATSSGEEDPPAGGEPPTSGDA